MAALTALVLAGSSGCLSDNSSGSRLGFSGKQSRPAEPLSPEFREAQKTFRKNTPKALLAWARYQEDVGEYAEAIRRYRELSIAYPDNIEARLGLARVENTTGRFEQAEEILKELAARYPDNTQIQLELGHLYSKREDWNAATAAFEQACRVSPHDQLCRYELGIALARGGLFDDALPHLTFAVGSPAAHYNIGYILHEEGRDAEAADWLTHSLSLHPDQKTAAQARRLLAQIPAGTAEEIAADTDSGMIEQEQTAAGEPPDEQLAPVRRAVASLSEQTGIRQASWVDDRQPVSRLKSVRQQSPAAGEEIGRASMPSSASAEPAEDQVFEEPGRTAPLEPPVWRRSGPVNR
jgi:tetratricopeptide (TPR) repeat protein